MTHSMTYAGLLGAVLLALAAPASAETRRPPAIQERPPVYRGKPGKLHDLGDTSEGRTTIRVWRRAVAGHPNARATKRIAVFAEGYLATERERFRADAERLASALAMDGAGHQLLGGWNFVFHFVFVPSQTAMRLDARTSRTAFEGSVSYEIAGGIVRFPTGLRRAQELAARALGKKQDVLTILYKAEGEQAKVDRLRSWANLPRSDSGGFISQCSHCPEAFVHELGHALLGLQDEYVEEGKSGSVQSFDENWPNLVAHADSLRWRHLTPKLHEGGATFPEGVYRAFERCRMNQSHSEAFCKACTAHMDGVWLAERAQSDPSAERTGTKAWSTRVALLDPAHTGSTKAGNHVLLSHTQPFFTDAGLMRAREGEPVVLQWCVPAKLPKKGWKIQIVEGQNLVFEKVLALTTTSLTVSGLRSRPPERDRRDEPRRYTVHIVDADEPWPEAGRSLAAWSIAFVGAIDVLPAR
ncbi:MAG: hypothetical protein KIT58_09665 [Planctomycetota bacterium]|nr:hypothetical protein [Planctomycetota bacterium]